MEGRDKIVSRVSAAWLSNQGPSGDVILSSRVRLARNLSGYPFPHRLVPDQALEIVDLVRRATRDDLYEDGPFDCLDMGQLSDLERQVLVEKHVISPQMAMRGKGSLLILSGDERVSIMVNEEDHLRLQCLLPGLSAGDAWNMVSRVDDVLEQELDYAFSADRGYLTSCPTNTGTGMRVSVMIHIPALGMMGQVAPLLSSLGKVGVAVRGLFGEGTQAEGNIYQVSNQVSLGRPEDEIISNLVGLAGQIRDQERRAREALLSRDRVQLEDRIYRAYGVLTGARVMSSGEMMRLLSEISLGMDLNLIPQIGTDTLKTLQVMARPGYLQYMAGAALGERDRDIRRASLVRRYLAGKEMEGG